MHSRHSFGLLGIDRQNVSMGLGAADERQMERPGQLQVGHVVRTPKQKARIFHPLDTGTDKLGLQRLAHARVRDESIALPAALIASTMNT